MSEVTVTAPDDHSTEPVQTYRISWPQQILGVIGFALSLFSYREFLVVAAGGFACGSDNSYISCDRVLASGYSSVFNIPLGIFGMVFFAIMIITSVDTDLRVPSVLRSAFWRLAVATAGLISSVGMLYISFFLIKAMCPICIATHTVSISNFGYSLFDYLRLRRARKNPTAPIDSPPPPAQ